MHSMDGGTPFVIRPMNNGDVHAMVHVHLLSFPGFFLTFLGKGFLKELYRSIIADRAGFGFVCLADERICGLVVGTLEPSSFYRRLLRQRWSRFGVAAFTSFLRRPSIFPRLIRAFSAPRQSAALDGCALLMSIAVLPETQCRGMGGALLKTFIGEIGRRGIRTVTLSTDALDNEEVNSFYRKHGFVCVRTFVTPEGRYMNEYSLDIASRHTSL